jgi:thiol-disulfide isomerase/thioredoxin
MDAVTLGPFVLSADRFAALLALAGLLLSAEILGRRLKQPPLIAWAWNAATVGLIAARLVFVATHPAAFAQEPLSIVMFWQGGFSAWGGIVAAAIYTGWRFRSERRTLVWTLAPGLVALLAWGGFQGVALLSRPAAPPTLFTTRLASLEGEPLAPADLLGTPVVVNLWATWCGPCRRELPLLSSVAAEEGGVAFVFISQGETPAQVERYLAEGGFDLPIVLLDPAGAIGEAARSRGLPTTLFFDAEGELIYRSLGELSRARLQDGLDRIR